MGIFINRGLLLILLASSHTVAIELQDQLDSVILIDERNTSTNNTKKHAVLGCSNTIKIDELKCSKERETTAPKFKELPQNKKFDKPDSNRDNDIKEIKSQLNDILKQLAALTKDKNSTHTEEVTKQLKNIAAIQKQIGQDKNITTLPKKIKVLKVNSDHDVIEVQSGESLSKYAQKYYKNSRKYQPIYRANPNKISETLEIFVGDKLIVPTSDTFKYKVIEVKKVEDKEVEDNKSSKPKEEIKEEVKTLKEDNDTITKVKIIDPIDKAIYVEEDNKSSETKKPEIKKEIEKEIENNNTKQAISWIETKIPKGIDIYQLSQKYYGDKKEYHHIYNLNKGIIGSDLKIKEGMLLKIPITKLFQEKPEYLNIR